jgi:23S rRNA pseudouridine2605 synthase
VFGVDSVIGSSLILAKIKNVCYQRGMNDTSRKNGGGKGRPPRGPGGGGRNGGPGRGGRPPARGGSSRGGAPDRRGPRASRPEANEETPSRSAFRPRRPAESSASERPAEGRKSGGRPFSSRPPREQGDRPRPPRAAGDRPFRERREGDRPTGDRPFRERREGERPAGSRPPRDKAFGDRKDRGRAPDRRGGRPTRSAPRPAPKTRPGDRIAKVMARAGLCSRRDAEAWILDGRVIVNGEVLTSPARDIVPTDKVEVDGQPLPLRERTRLFLYHKPRGLVTTARDPEGRPTVFAHLPKGLPRVISIGRLDINTEGLLLLTNDGGLGRLIELPDTGWLRRYRVRCYGEVNQAVLDTLRGGITVDGMHYGPIEATLDREKGDNVWLTLGLREGKNREVKRVLEHLGLQVNRLIRISFGPFQLGDLDEGAVEEVKTGFLRDQLGPDMIASSGVDFDAPIFRYDEEPDDIMPAPDDARRDRGRDRDHDRGPRRERSDRRDFAEKRLGRPDRDRTATPHDDAEKPTRPKRPHRNEPTRKIWRADDVQDSAATRSLPKVPRRGQDPKAARAENAERAHHRAGKITTRGGKTVMVEKLAPSGRADIARSDTKRASAPDRQKTKSAGKSFDKPVGRSFSKPSGKGGDRPFGKPKGPRPPRSR